MYSTICRLRRDSRANVGDSSDGHLESLWVSERASVLQDLYIPGRLKGTSRGSGEFLDFVFGLPFCQVPTGARAITIPGFAQHTFHFEVPHLGRPASYVKS